MPISGSQYWAGVSPLISKSLGMSGLGIFGASFRGLGDALGPPLIDASGNLVQTTDAQNAANLAALQKSAAQGGFDTSAGSYSVDPNTGAVTFVPVNVPSTSLIAGVSNGVLAVGALAALAFVGIALGGRR